MTKTKKKITKVTPQKSTEIEKAFVPSPAMLKWFATATELGYTARISEVAKESKLDRKNWYLWIAKNGFVEWWDGEWQQYLKVNRWKLDAIGMKQSELNFNYWHDMMQRVGNISNGDFSQEFQMTWRKK